MLTNTKTMRPDVIMSIIICIVCIFVNIHTIYTNQTMEYISKHDRYTGNSIAIAGIICCVMGIVYMLIKY
jgi:uncharacterized membrane protein YidH (DUF202 family)